MNLPGSVLHPLTGDLRGFWSVRVSGNWRVIFRFEDGHAWDVDLVDYQEGEEETDDRRRARPSPARCSNPPILATWCGMSAWSR